ncbi:hypothetical protein [Marinilactibacillus sp. Marseille-P9653]|uniref:hypothetical protein n=1 Tax=Marinilactibacillus sp. Marseille-P9653 TaxID=2866583 RepID=UPI001CE424FD|nr:hypothetical protein [Marinilactibacillus sp. Marseille-P9653]
MQIYNSNMGDSGYAVKRIKDRIETPRTGSRDIFLSPNGTGVVRIANTARDYYNIRASTFLDSSIVH